jgi:hypothetical protein
MMLRMTTAEGSGAETALGEAGGSSRAWRTRLVAALVLAAALIAFYAPALGDGRFLYRDTGRMHAPVKQFLGEELRAGRFPSWNPYYGLGMPTVGASVDSVLHPFTLLAAALPVHVAVKLWVFLASFAGGMGAWAWARRLGAGPGGATAGALAFALSGFMVSSSDNLTYLTAYATAPWVFAAGDLWIARGGPAPLAGLALSSGLCAAAGDPLGWALAVAGSALFPFLLQTGAPAPRRLQRVVVGVLACALAAAPALLPLLAWLPHSHRAVAFDPEIPLRWNLAPARLLELVSPGLLRDGGGVTISPLHMKLADPRTSVPWVTSVYVGITVVCLAAAAALRGARGRVLVALSLVALWCAMGFNAGFGQLASGLPLLRSLAYWEKLAGWPALFLSVAAALGVERVGSDAGSARRLALAAGGVAALSLGASLLSEPLAAALAARAHGDWPGSLTAVLAGNLGDGLRHAGAVSVALALAAWMIARGRLPRAAAALAAIVALDLAGANVRAYHLHRPEVDRPPSRLASFLHRSATLERVVTPFEPVVLNPATSPSEALSYCGALTLKAAWNVAYRVGNFETYSGPMARRLDDVARALGTRRFPQVGLWGFGYVLVPGDAGLAAGQNVPASAPVVASDPTVPAYMFELPHRPRAYVAREVVAVDAPGALAFALDPASAAGDRTVVEGAIAAGVTKGEGEASLIRDDATAIDVRARATGEGLLVLNDLHAPGWSATVDGVERPIVAANYLARGVWIPAGEHVVRFRYRTPGLAAGVVAALLAAAAIAAWALARRWAARRRAGAPQPGGGS